MIQASIVAGARPGRAQIVAASLTALVALAIAVGAVPYGTILLPVNTGFLPAYGSVTGFADLFTAVLLLGQARATDSRPAVQLAAAYLFSFLMVIPHLLSFPGVFAAEPLIGGTGTTPWLWCAWHAGFALFVAHFALVAERDSTRPARGSRVFPVMIATAALSVLIATLGSPYLPTLLVGGTYQRITTFGIGPAVMACNAAAFILVVLKLRGRSTVALWLAVAMFAAFLEVSLGVLGGGRYSVGWYLGRGLGLLANVTVFVALLFQSMRLFERVSTLNLQLERLSLTDQLTQLPNRRAFEGALEAEWKRAKREELPMSMLMVDIDQFKTFNDHLGHPAGDRCLRLVAETLNAQARRPMDLAARLGGEEFTLLLPNTEAPGATHMGERVRAAVAALRIHHPVASRGIVTISVGVATAYPHGQGTAPTDLVSEADEALYEAKRSGRDTVQFAGRKHGTRLPPDGTTMFTLPHDHLLHW